MKILIKKLFIILNLWHPLNLLRRAPEALNWFRSGLSGYAPHPVKMKVIEAYIKKFSIEDFVETGTYHGDTLEYIAKRGVRCISIELSQDLFQAACIRFKSYRNVRLVQGDSGKKLPELLKELTKPACFWLDGHYSYGVTASTETHTPISIELDAILRHHIKQHVILIDDARCFDGTNNYPHLDDLLRVIRNDGGYSAEVSTDIIRLIPRAK